MSQVHAIQLLRERVRSSGKNSGRYLSYQLNLVLKDGSRLNLIDHSNQKKILEDSQRLSEWIKIPIWNAL